MSQGGALPPYGHLMSPDGADNRRHQHFGDVSDSWAREPFSSLCFISYLTAVEAGCQAEPDEE